MAKVIQSRPRSSELGKKKLEKVSSVEKIKKREEEEETKTTAREEERKKLDRVTEKREK